jgi:hypothetical protein
MAQAHNTGERRCCKSVDAPAHEANPTDFQGVVAHPAADAPDWMECMRRGDFSAAWNLSDAILRARAGSACAHLPRHEQWVWNGMPLDGKRVLIRCYHGLGDTVQFVRYVPRLRQIAREVYLWVQPELIPLVERVPGADRVLPLHDGAPEIDYDVDVEIMELAHVFRTTVQTIPREIPYLIAEPAPLGPRTAPLRVGIAWAAGDWDERRSVPFEMVRPLADIEGVELHALQRGVRCPPEFGVDHSAANPLQTARLLSALDLVVSVDSFPAHLAGALGRPTWTLLHSECDWRWMRDRDSSPWYPTMRLFRQSSPGDWTTVIDRVAAELQIRANNAGAASISDRSAARSSR